MSKFRKLLALSVVVAIFAALAGVVTTYAYYREVAGEVEKAFATYRWDVPSRVYSDRQPLYAGLDVAKQGLAERLERSGYRTVASVSAPGEFATAPSLLEFYQRPFEHPTLGHAARRVRLTLAGGVITRIEVGESREPVAIVFLEPEILAVLVGDTWQNRELVRIDDMPAAMTQAVVAIEDRRFFAHEGVDPKGIARAIVKDLLQMRLVEGGSTLTQQLVKNIILNDPSRRFSRKYKEVVMAYIIDREYSKDEILSKYLNEIYFGQDGAYEVRGIGSAARYYFAKPVEELTVTECAVLAGIIHGPNLYSKRGEVRADRITARRNQVLEAMYQEGYVTEQALSRMKLEQPVLRVARPQRRLAPYFIDLLQRRLREEYSTAGLAQEGLAIYTTLQMHVQELAEQAVTKNLARLEAKYSRLRRSDPQQQLQAAVVLLRPATGEIVALVGGRDYGTTPYDRVHRAVRQPGSLIKPFIYLTALAQAADSPKLSGGFSPLYPLNDTLTTFRYQGVEYAPNNYDRRTRGVVPAYYALSRSLNIPAVELLEAVGPPAVAHTLASFGITTPFADLLPSALGVNEVYPVEIARAFGALANGGQLAQTRIISNVVDRGGRLLDHTTLRTVEAAQPPAVAMLVSMLEETVNHGTARAIRRVVAETPLAGKTGTTDGGKDAWFVGFSADLLGLVWVGFDDGTPLGLTGSSAALPIWIDIFSGIDLAGDDFVIPVDAERLRVDVGGAGIALESCPRAQVISLVFAKDRLPTNCSLHDEGLDDGGETDYAPLLTELD